MAARSNAWRLSMPEYRSGSLVDLLEKLLWCGFLVILFSCSFVFGGYATRDWLMFSGVFYLWFSIYLLIVGLGAKANYRALKAARVCIGLLLFSLVWLYFQMTLPFSHALYGALSEPSLVSQVAPPSWFRPEAVWSVTPSRTQWLLLSESLFFCMFLSVLAIVHSRQRLRILLIMILIVGVVHSAIGLVSKTAGLLLVDIKELDGHFSAARGLFINRNHFGGFVVICLFGGIGWQLRFFSKYAGVKAREMVIAQFTGFYLWAFVAIAFGMIAVISSESRAASFSIIVAFVLVITLTKRDDKVLGPKFLSVIVIIGAMLLLYFGQELLARIVKDGFSLGERWEQWKFTLAAIGDNPLFGYGGGSYSTVFQSYRHGDDFRQVVYAQSHNYYLHLWLERGLIGLTVWVALLFTLLKHAYHHSMAHRSSLVRSSMGAALIIIVASMIQSMVDYNLQMLTIRSYFMVLLALVLAAPEVEHRVRSHK